jgi:metal-responsive CopG/Arc/MetJ family transcriptional regulator
MAKKVAISITIDGDILRQLDAYVRQVQERELRSRRSLSTRSSVIERIIREGLGGERAS